MISKSKKAGGAPIGHRPDIFQPCSEHNIDGVAGMNDD